MTELIQHPFAPVYCKESQILVLGTMPSPASRDNAFYYTHPRNRFWTVLSAVFTAPFPQSKEDKINLILKNKLALWDVLASCNIKGASDSSIANPQANDFSALLNQTKIDTILCTGKKAFSLYQKLCLPKTGIEATVLPSTSPANQRISLEALITAYTAVLRPGR